MSKQVYYDEESTTWVRPILLARLRLASMNHAQTGNDCYPLIAVDLARFARCSLRSSGLARLRLGRRASGLMGGRGTAFVLGFVEARQLVPSRKEVRGSY